MNELRLLPHDDDAEKAVLSSMLYDREAIGTAMEILKKEDFYRPENQLAFGAMVSLFIANSPVDPVTLKDKLSESGEATEMGVLVAKIAASFSTSAHIKEYSKIVEEHAIFRKLIKASGDIQAECYEAKEGLAQILDKAEKRIFDIVQDRNSQDFAHINDILVTVLHSIEETAKNQGKITGVPTGFLDFDLKTAGLQPSDLVLIAARPSMGKTALILNIAQNAAVRNAIPTAIFSLEMSKEQLANRLVSAEAMLDSQKIRTGSLLDEDWAKISMAVGSLSNAPLYIDDTPGISIGELRAKCRRLKLEKGLGLVMIDYLQLMSGSGGKNESRQQEISEISRALKSVAREIKAPVIACSQLSRACEARADHRPMLSDLRESGAIEQDADVVTFLYRDEYYNPDTEHKGLAELIIAKQRNGPTGTAMLRYLGEYTRFVNIM